MSNDASGTPWPIWAAVTILCAVIGAFAVIYSSRGGSTGGESGIGGGGITSNRPNSELGDVDVSGGQVSSVSCDQQNDLNGDGQAECFDIDCPGSGGACFIYIYRRAGQGYISIGKMVGARVVDILPASSNGYHDVAVLRKWQGAPPPGTAYGSEGKIFIYRWDGNQYR
jgi:hypothetical protein